MLPVIQNIIYASDFEPGARPAFRRAVSLCRQYDATITFLHVIEPPNRSAENMIGNILEPGEKARLLNEGLSHLREKMERRIQRFYDSELDENEKLKPGQVEMRVEQGVPWRVITTVAAGLPDSVIVMGTRTHSRLGQLMGSTATKIIGSADCPVMVVPL